MKILLALMMTWLSANFDLPKIPDPPDVKLVTRQEMVSARYHGMIQHAGAGATLVAVYDDRSKTVMLADDWTPDTPAELSVLVHELVHHVQNTAKLTYFCPEAREAVAYAAQEKWLSLFGQSLETAFGIDPLTLKVRTSCM
jgi:hypothetical protein